MERSLRYAEFVLFGLAALIVLAAPALAQGANAAPAKPKPPAGATAAAPSSGKQAVRVDILDTATYDDALKCFHYYAIAHETASKFAALDKATDQQEAALRNEAGLAKFLQAQWQHRITLTKGDKTEAAVNADLKKIAVPMLADANKALEGDKAARERGASQGKACAKLEKTTKIAPPA